MPHPITDFKAIYPEYFNKILNEYKQEIQRYKNGSWICRECDNINPISIYRVYRGRKMKQVVKGCDECGARSIYINTGSAISFFNENMARNKDNNSFPQGHLTH